MDCVAHARMFFNRPDFDLASAAPGSFALSPHDEMIEQLRIDYRAMQGMIFGDPPDFPRPCSTASARSRRTFLNENGARESGRRMKQFEGAIGTGQEVERTVWATDSNTATQRRLPA